MAKLLTTKQIQDKYKPNLIYKEIELAYKKNKKRLARFIKEHENILLNKSSSSSDLERATYYVESLKDAVYYLEKTEEERLEISKRLREYKRELNINRFKRINYIVLDNELCEGVDTNIPQYMDMVTQILVRLKLNIMADQKFLNNTKAGHLTGLRIGLYPFFNEMHSNKVRQKDQINIVMNLFREFKNKVKLNDDVVRVQLQQPAKQNRIKSAANWQLFDDWMEKHDCWEKDFDHLTTEDWDEFHELLYKTNPLRRRF